MFIQHLSDCDEFVAGDKTLLREVLHPRQHPVNIPYSIAHARIAAGGASLPHRLTSSETYYILSGQGRIFMDGQPADLRPHSIAVVPADVLQHVENTGNEDLVFLCIVHPAWAAEGETVVYDK